MLSQDKIATLLVEFKSQHGFKPLPEQMPSPKLLTKIMRMKKKNLIDVVDLKSVKPWFQSLETDNQESSFEMQIGHDGTPRFKKANDNEITNFNQWKQKFRILMFAYTITGYCPLDPLQKHLNKLERLHERHYGYAQLIIKLDKRIRAEWCISQTEGNTFVEAVSKEYSDVINEEFFHKILTEATNSWKGNGKGKGKGFGKGGDGGKGKGKGFGKGADSGKGKGDSGKGKGKNGGKGKPQQWWENRTEDGKIICRRFQTGQCTDNDCAYTHVCGVKGCAGNHMGQYCPNNKHS